MKQCWGVVAVLVFASCGPKPAVDTPPPPKGDDVVGAIPEAQKRYPALRWVPADVTYAAVAGTTADVVTAAREVINALGMMYGEDADDLDGWLRRDLGLSVLATNDLVDMGIALDRSAAIFSQHVDPTLLLPVADAAKVDSFIVTKRTANASVTQRGGTTVMVWQAADELAVHWARVGDYLAIHFTMPTDELDLSWLEGVESVPEGAGLAVHADFEDAEAVARRISPDKLPSIVGLIRIGALASSIGELLSGRDASCLSQMVGATGGRFLFGFDVHYDRSAGIGVLKLGPSASAALAAHTAEPAPGGFYAFRDTIGAYGSLGIDPEWVDRVQQSTGCWVTGGPLVGPGSLPANGPRGWNLAVESLSVDQLEGRLAVNLALRDKRFVLQYLDQIPRRSWFEKTVSVAGQDVTRLGVPMFPAVFYRLGDTEVTMSVGDGIMDRVLGPGNPPDGAELVALGVHPSRLPNLEELIRSVATLTPLIHPSVAHSLTVRIERYEFAKIQIVLDGDEVVATASMKLRPM